MMQVTSFKSWREGFYGNTYFQLGWQSMIRQVLSEGLTNEDMLRGVIESVARKVGAKASFSKVKGTYFASVDSQEGHLLDLRITEHVCEFYMECSNVNFMEILNLVGFNDLHDVLTKYEALPARIVILKSVASRSLYILLEGREGIPSLPNIRVIIKENERSATSSYCRISKEENICDLLNDLIDLGKKLWNEFFGTC